MVTKAQVLTPTPDETATPIYELRALVEMYYDTQMFRVRGNNRVKALEKNEQPAERLTLHVEKLKEFEQELARQIPSLVKHEPIADWLMSQRGIGPVMAAALICSGLSHFDKNGKPLDKPSGWWRYAGVGVVDGKNQRLRQGEKRSYNGFLRRTLYVLLGGWLKAHKPEEGKPSFYAELYYQFKAESERERPEVNLITCTGPDKKGCVGEECPKCHGAGKVGSSLHHHKRAAMLTCRVFLTHLQQKWREADGLPPPRNLYIMEKEPGVHETIQPPA